MKLLVAGILLLLTHALPAAAYDYPIKDPYAATVLGTPAANRFSTTGPSHSGVEKLNLFPGRRVPAIFWYGNEYRVGIDLQDAESAPLIFILSGTGSTFESAKTRFLRDVFFDAGFHVVSLSSTTTDEFITSGSRSSRPGNIGDDAVDLYRIMKLTYDSIWTDTRADGFYLTGFSIGALYSAYLGELDSREQYFKFNRILMLNPPVNLYNSALRLDRLIEENLPGGITRVGDFVEQVFKRYAPYFNQVGGLEIDSEFLFALQKNESLSSEELKVLVGLVFRLAASSMVFTSDVMTHSGKVVSTREKITTGDTLTGYFKQTLYWGFKDYFERILLPYMQSREPDIIRQDLIHRLSLDNISGYLARTQTIGVITSRDDIILDESDLEFLSETFGDRATIYPTGGHGGNIEYTDNIMRMLEFFNVQTPLLVQ